MFSFKKRINSVIMGLFSLFFALITPATALAASVEINEFMANPGPGSVITSSDGEWVELTNTTNEDIDLSGWTIDGAPLSGVIKAHGSIVVCNNTDVESNGSVRCTGQVNLSLTDSGDTIVLKDNTNETIDTVTYEASDIVDGRSTNVERDGNGDVSGLNSENTATFGKDAESANVQYGTPSENKITNDNASKANHSYGDVNHAVNDSDSGDTISIGEGTYNVREQVNINHNLKIQGANTNQTKLTKNFNTGTSGDSKGWFLVQPSAEFNLSDLTIDGSGSKTWQALRVLGSGSVNNVNFTEIKYQDSGQPYAGTAIATLGNGTFDVTNSEFNQIGRIGTQYYGSGVNGSQFNNNTYTGKGLGNWLDYGLEISGGAQVSASNIVITNNLGVADSDGSSSAGILVSTYFGSGSSLDLADSKVTGNTTGLYVGYDTLDTSTVTASNNSFANNEYAIVAVGDSNVDAQQNWFGDESGPSDSDGTDGSTPASNTDGLGCEVFGPVNYSNWLTSDPFGEGNVQCDQHNPEVTITNPNDNDTVKGTVDIRATINDDDNDITSCTVSITGSGPDTKNEACENSGNIDNTTVDTWDTTSFADGNYTVTVSVQDTEGNEASDTINVVVDNTPPDVTVDTKTTSDTTPPLSGTVSDPDATVSVTVNGTTYNATNDGGGTWSVADNVVGPLAPGTYDVQVSATDSVGNIGTDTTTNELTITPAEGGRGGGGVTNSGSEVVAAAVSENNGGRGGGFNPFSQFFQPVIASTNAGETSTTTTDQDTLAAGDNKQFDECGQNSKVWIYMLIGTIILGALLYLFLFTRLIPAAYRETAALISSAGVLVATALFINTVCGNHLLHYLIMILISVLGTAYALRQFRGLEIDAE